MDVVDATLPGKSLDVQFEMLWQRFSRLPRTIDTLGRLSARLRRLTTPINVSFLVPLTDPAVNAYLISVQETLAPYMTYAPQPAARLHITLHQLGYLRAGIPLPRTWTPEALGTVIENTRTLFARFKPFTVRVGPINAFPNVLIAEVHDSDRLRLLARALIDLLPPSRRQRPPYPLIPHVTLGFFGDRPTEPIIRAVQPLREQPSLPLTVDQVLLTLYYPDFGPYHTHRLLEHSVEDVIARLPLGEERNARL